VADAALLAFDARLDVAFFTTTNDAVAAMRAEASIKEAPVLIAPAVTVACAADDNFADSCDVPVLITSRVGASAIDALELRFAVG